VISHMFKISAATFLVFLKLCILKSEGGTNDIQHLLTKLINFVVVDGNKHVKY
jgi:hypothetical protein